MAKKQLSPEQELVRLKKIWDKKLRDTKSAEYPNGFEDIENDQGGLKKYTTDRKGNAHAKVVNWEASAQYYQMASSFLNDYRFDTEFDKTVWTYHSEGLSKYDISKIFKKLFKNKRGYGTTTIRTTIARLRKSMFSMYLLPVKPYYEL